MNLTGSGLTRAMHCAPSVLLPQVRTTTVFSSWGNVVHDYMHNIPTLGAHQAWLKAPAEYQAALEVINLDGLPLDPKAWAQEVAFAFDCRTGMARELGRGMSRDYSGAGPSEICGTVDVVGLTEDMVIVPDYKTGWTDLGPLSDNLTMRFYGLCAARAFSRTRARLEIIRIPDDGGEPFHTSWEMDELDLDATEYEVRELWEKLAGVGRRDGAPLGPHDAQLPIPHEGPWCRFCPAYAHCPAKMNLVAQLVREVGLGAALEPREDGIMPPVLNAETAPAVYDRLVQVDALVARLWSSVQDFARLEPIRLANGKVYGERKRGEDKIEAETALPLLIERFGPHANMAMEVVKKIPKKAVEALLMQDIQGKKNAQGKRVTKKEAWAELWMHLCGMGAARTTFAPRMDEHKPAVEALPQDGEPEVKPVETAVTQEGDAAGGVAT